MTFRRILGVGLTAAALTACAGVEMIPSPFAGCDTAPPDVFEAVDWSAARRITVRIRHGEFEPSLIRLYQGRPYILRVENRDRQSRRMQAADFFEAVYVHSVIAGADGPTSATCPSGIRVPAGESAEVRFIAARDGRYEYSDTMIPYAFGRIAGGIVRIERMPDLSALASPVVPGITKPADIPTKPYEPVAAPVVPQAPETPPSTEPAGLPVVPQAPETPPAPTEPAGLPWMPASPPEAPQLPTEPAGLPVVPQAPETPPSPAEPAGLPWMPAAPPEAPPLPTEPAGLPVVPQAPEIPSAPVAPEARPSLEPAALPQGSPKISDEPPPPAAAPMVPVDPAPTSAEPAVAPEARPSVAPATETPAAPIRLVPPPAAAPEARPPSPFGKKDGVGLFGQ